jgi:hypothetical protein
VLAAAPTSPVPGGADTICVFVDGKYISADTWYDADGKPFRLGEHLIGRIS